MRVLHCLITTAWWRSNVPQKWKHAGIKVLYPKTDTAECDNYRGMSSVVAGTGKVLLRVTAYRSSNFCKAKYIYTEEQYGCSLSEIKNPRAATR